MFLWQFIFDDAWSKALALWLQVTTTCAKHHPHKTIGIIKVNLRQKIWKKNIKVELLDFKNIDNV